MKRVILFPLMAVLILSLAACGQPEERPAVAISLSDTEILVDGNPIGSNTDAAVYIANDIIYYEAGHNFTYGEGTEADAHSPEEAAAHTVIHITQPGTYSLSGKLSLGQIAVDLGKDADEDPDAVVTLVLDGVDITCRVAPGIIFYNVYECGDDDEDKATKNVDTSAAGANVIIADGTENTVRGAYVARIYEPDSVELNAAGTNVEDAKKLHKYDGAFYSKMSMNISGGTQGTGKLLIEAENEGLDSELHLTINGGNITICSGNDGINTNADGVSVTTVNGGTLDILVTGETGEGDGIDSNGWLVINGGTVTAAACATSADSGIDSDMGIHINGGTVIASGHMLDRIQDGGQTYSVFRFTQEQTGREPLVLKTADGEELLRHSPGNAYSILVFSSPDLKEGNYTLWSGDTPLAGVFGMGGGMGPGGMPPGGMGGPGNAPEFGGGERPEFPGNGQPPAGEAPPDGMTPGQQPPQMPGDPPEGGREPGDRGPGGPSEATGEPSTDFRITQGANDFGGIAPV